MGQRREIQSACTTRADRFDVRLALALFCLLTCLYWLTASAHTYIADGETVYLVTEGLVERGTFVQLEPEQAGDAPRTVARAPNGNLYAVTGPLQSLLAVPFYLVGRWMARSGRLRIYAQPKQALTIQVAYSRPRSADAEETDWPGLHFLYSGAPVPSERQLVAENERETKWVETLVIPASDVHVFPGTLGITATTWVPLGLGDSRALSVFVSRLEVSSDGSPLASVEANLPRPLPVSTAYPWSWEAMFRFYDPLGNTARPFDVWPWYVWTSGVPLPQARAFIAILSLVLGACFIASSLCFILTAKRSEG